MISDLIKFDAEQQEKGEVNSDALGKAHFQAELIINEDGSLDKIHILEEKNDRTYREAGGRTSGVRAFLLLDNATYTLGQEKDGTFASIEGQGYAAERLRAYIERLKEFKDVPSIKPVLLFYEDNRGNGLEAAKRSLSEEDIEKLKGGMNIAFRLPRAGQYVHQCDDVVQALETRYQENVQKELKSNQYCSLCGKNDSPIVDEPHGGIKGIPGGLSTGCMLVSYNKSSFLSYGLDRNLNSSICKRCAKSYTRALNILVNERETISIKAKEGKEEKTIERRKYAEKISADTLLIFWCKNKEAAPIVHTLAGSASEEEEIDFDNIDAPAEEEPATLGEAQNLTSAPKYGPSKNKTYVNTEHFYACVLAAAAGRIAVKDWMHTTLSEVKTNVKQWFDDIELVTGNEKSNFFYSVSRLINFKQSSNDKNDGRAGQLLWHAALMGGPLPLGLLSPLLHSVRMSVIKGENIAPRISLIKAILNRNLKEGGMKLEKELNVNEPNPAYICGRIFSVFEAVQDLDGVKNAGIVQRFFSAASSSPAVAFSRLFKLNKHHLEKLSKDSKNAGSVVYWEKRLGELCEKIENAFPEKLALKDQGYFALGYYHEKQARFKKKEKEEDKKDE